MRAVAGDELLVKGRHVGDVDREGVIVEVHGANGAALPGSLEGQKRECVPSVFRHGGGASSPPGSQAGTLRTLSGHESAKQRGLPGREVSGGARYACRCHCEGVLLSRSTSGCDSSDAHPDRPGDHNLAIDSPQAANGNGITLDAV